MAWFSNYLFRKLIPIIGSADGIQTNYQVKLTVYYTAGTDSAVYRSWNRSLRGV